MQRRTPLIFIATALLAFDVAAQDWKKQLADPLVKLTGRTMLYEQYELCSIPAARKDKGQAYSLQVRTRSEAPQGRFISRDNFVAITAAVAVNALGQFGDAECKTLKAPIGTPDLEISIQMTEEGLQVEYHDTRAGQKNRSTSRWETLFAQ